MYKTILSILFVFMILSATIPVSAQEIKVDVKSIDPSPYYDSNPRINNNYIVWRRAVNQNNNEYIELKEPSWIMVYDIEKGKTWNITDMNTILGGSNIFSHAQSPEIYGDKIIYEKQGSANSWDTRLCMYNISSKKTWEIPLRSTTKAHGHFHQIYNDWIAYTHIENGKRQAYLLNYENWNYRTIISKNDNYSVYGMVMHGNYVVITALNETNDFEILIYNIQSGLRESINLIRNYSKIIATSISGDRIALNLLETNGNNTQWNTYIYNINSQSLFKHIDNTYGLMIYGDNTAYQMGNNIYYSGTNITVIQSIGSQRLGDIHGNEIVWTDNSNGESQYGDARDDWDIFFREQVTPTEMISTNMIFIIIIVILVIIGGIASRNGSGEMI